MKNTIQNILIPIDLSNSSLNALHTAMQMAVRQKAHLDLLYVQDIMDYYPASGQISTIDPMLDQVFEKNRYLLEKVCSGIQKDFGISCVPHYMVGVRKRAICEKAKELGSDLIVIGTEAGLEDQSYLFDSLPYYVINNTNCHVMTVPEGREISNFNRIVMPVQPVASMLDKMSVIKPIIQQNNSAVDLIGLVKKNDGNVFGSVRKIVYGLKRKVRSFSPRVRTSFFYTENAHKQILNTANERSADLLFIDGDIKRDFFEFFKGGFIQHLIRNPNVAVFCAKDVAVRPDGDNKQVSAHLSLA